MALLVYRDPMPGETPSDGETKPIPTGLSLPAHASDCRDRKRDKARELPSQLGLRMICVRAPRGCVVFVGLMTPNQPILPSPTSKEL
jgi:hypothetical protein